MERSVGKNNLICDHVWRVFNGQDTWERIQVAQMFLQHCEDCRHVAPSGGGGRVWMCLEIGCDYVGCSRSSRDHIGQHVKETGHLITVCLENGYFWCRGCDAEMTPHGGCAMPPQQDGKSTTTPLLPSGEKNVLLSSGEKEMTPAPSGVKQVTAVPPSESGITKQRIEMPLKKLEDTSRPISKISSDHSMKHLFQSSLTCPTPCAGDLFGMIRRVGLMNTGNTCYVNSALQALSNCGPFERYFQDRSSVDNPDSLARSYHLLLGDMQTLHSRNSQGGLKPCSVIDIMRRSYPVFQEQIQHDTQEFIRSFLDKLHDELKLPYTVTPMLTNESQTGVGSPCILSSLEEGRGLSYRTESKDSGVFGSGFSGTASSSSEDDVYLCPKPKNENQTDQPAGNSDKVSKETQERDGHYSRLGNVLEWTKANGYTSIVTETFEGVNVNVIQCLSCENLSKSFECFLDLSLPIPENVPEKRESTSPRAPSMPASDATIAPKSARCKRICNCLPKPLRCSLCRSRKGGKKLKSESIRRLVSASISAARMEDPIYAWGELGKDTIPEKKGVDLEDCIASYFGEEFLTGENMYSCSTCAKLTNGIKTSKLVKLPEVLCITLMRFKEDYTTFTTTKVKTFVSFPINGLRLDKYQHEDSKDDRTYDLVAVICHAGSSVEGHYTTFARDPACDRWLFFNDDKVIAVDASEVVREEAYVLFYQSRKNL